MGGRYANVLALVNNYLVCYKGAMKTTMTVEQAKKALGVALDRELAEWFRVSPGSVFNWRDNGTLPAGKVAILQLHLMSQRVRA